MARGAKQEALAQPRPHTADPGAASALVRRTSSWTEVSVDVAVVGPPRPATSLAHARPGTAMSGHAPLSRKTVRLEPYVAAPSRRASARERLQQKGGAVASTTSIAWDWPRAGPFLTSLVLESPRAPDFQIDMCMDADDGGVRARPLSPQRDALVAGLQRARVSSPRFFGKERAHLSSTAPDSLSILTAEMNRLAGQKDGILQEADSRTHFLEMDDEDLSDALQMLIQRNLKQLEQEGGIAELNTLRPREYTTRRVRQVSEHLLTSKSEKKIPLKVKSFRVRQEELEQKIGNYRSNQAQLAKRARQLKFERLQANGGGSQIIEFRKRLEAGAFGPEKAAELRTLRLLQEEVRLLAVQRKRKTLLAEASENITRGLQEKAARKEAMHRETERKRQVARSMQLVQVLLPATFAAARLGLWANRMKTGRVDRAELAEKSKAVLVFQRFWKWRLWTRNFKFKIYAKAILSKHMWKICMQWRIRRKMRAVSIIVTGLREMSSTLEVVAAFARYKYKIRVMQRCVRATLAAIKSQVSAVKAQYHKTLLEYRHAHVSGDGKSSPKQNKDQKKKKTKKGGDNTKSAASLNFLLLPQNPNNEVVEVLFCIFA